ncbi:MAG TPA: transposase [Acidiferrobacterales bacterium]
MPRRARLAVAGSPWHIIQRGNNRSACFYADEDYRRYLDTLEVLAERYGCALHAYVLMTNHVHLLLTPERRDSAGLLMKHLGQRYVQYINRTYRRSGTLWEGRYRSCLTQSEEYVLACYRYIELNPVRAGIVSHPREYRWSSYRANAEGRVNALLAPHPEFLQLGPTETERRAAYMGLFAKRLDTERLAEIRAATNGNVALGNERFRVEIERMLARRVTRGRPGRPRRERRLKQDLRQIRVGGQYD